ncbi:MAG: SDR family oxidoreductase [Sphingomonadales bacterium]|nr:SDR family oxidoreductase [Sphingomonadales bacterium]
MSFDLTGRTVLITGASAGIGAGFARTCAKAGANVVLGARRLASALAEEVGGLAVALDVSDEASVIAAYDAAEAKFGTVDSIVANAGVGTGGHATAIPVAGLQGVLNTNLLGAYLTAREGAKRLIATGSRDHQQGRVVLIGSTTALRAGMGDSLYAATKAGIEHLARNLAREWIRQGVNVNCLHPGMIPSEANAQWFASERGLENIAAQHRRRILAPDALDDMLLYLLSDRSLQVTGATFTIDDGQSL